MGADHFRSSAVFLTAAHPKQTDGPDIHNGVSIDQLYAQSAGKDTPCDSLQLGIENVDPTGSYGFHYNAVYADAISWASATEPLAAEINPRVIFEKLFGRAAGASVLDSTAGAAARLKAALGPGDAGRVEDFRAAVRDVERRIQPRRNVTPRRRSANCSERL